MGSVPDSGEPLGDTASLAAPSQSQASTATPSIESCVSTPATMVVDTPFENHEDDVRNYGKENHGHDYAATSRKQTANSSIMEDNKQLHELSVKLAILEKQSELDRLARKQLEEKLRDEIYPLASAGFNEGSSYTGLLRKMMKQGTEEEWNDMRQTFGFKTTKGDSIGTFTSISIDLLEMQLSQLKADLTEMTKLEKDRDRLRDMEELWAKERESLLEKQRQLGLLTGETKSNAAAPELGTKQPESKEGAPLAIFEKPELNVVGWTDFRLCLLKNPPDSFAIDVLSGEPDVSFERPTVTMWSRTNSRYSLERGEVTGAALHRDQKSEAAPTRGQKPIPERIRINSRHILRILSKIRDEPLTEDHPLVMIRPYKALDYWNEAIRSKFLELEKKFGDPEGRSLDKPPQETARGIPDDAAQTSDNTQVSHAASEEATEQEPAAKGEEDRDEWTYSLTAYQHLKCLISFMDEQLVEKVAFLESDRCRNVAFTDIWYLFKPGDEVVDQSLRQAYRIISISSAGHQVFPPWRIKWDKDAKAKEETPIILNCVYIDFDGKQLGPMVKIVRIPRYDKEKAVTSLEVFPLRFAEEKFRALASKKGEESSKTLREKLIERGKLFMDMTGFKHMRYNGVTLDTRDEVDSNVVVDFQEAFSHFQQVQKKSNVVDTRERRERDKYVTDVAENELVPRLRNLIGLSTDMDFDEEECRAECCRNEAEVKFKDAFAENKRNQDYMQSLMPEGRGEPPPSIYPRPLREIKGQENELIGGDYLIMSYRVFGFVLRSRKWAQLDLNHMSLPDNSPAHRTRLGSAIEADAQKGNAGEKQENSEGKGGVEEAKLKEDHGSAQETEDEDYSAFSQLVLPPGHKDMVKSLVAQHFRDKESQEEQQVDIVSGKGKGLIILLHGAPGVGKTTTAEGVAQMFEKPLYQITCGDLGTTASEVEKALETSFSLASRWGCVLLLDEADVFLAARSREDFKRNGLVSVFLRVLEYYTGVLFLTTNRIGDFDEAFASRIHISLYYPQLDLESTLSIFKLNLDMIEQNHRKGNIQIDREEILDFAKNYFNVQEDAKWNGRQIRNACHTALALAEFRAQGGSHKKIIDKQAVIHLKVDDLETVSKAYLEFMKYLTEVHDKKGFDMWAQSSNVRAKEKDFLKKMAKMYEDTMWQKTESKEKDQGNNHNPAQAPGHAAPDAPPQSSIYSTASPPPPQPGLGPTQHGAIPHGPPVTPSTSHAAPSGPIPPAPAPAPSEQPPPQQYPQTYGPAPGYPPASAWPGYYPAYGQAPPGNPGGPPPGARPYQPWQQYPAQPLPPPQQQPQQNAPQGQPYYPPPEGYVGPYPAQAPPARA
ncbi:hypothetical protein L207DRAFT_454313 [Hyaloscypha variabilis F]|uniref:AAA+ ATPase domain-containing protein n=1 Tax=Hyaloscypha variabilis (strain UAMH 11265 / GT02V1 / F) TaxID=1149755 RepID=A0A2J6S1H1_HYAVF|nr:hypothetical protein L207DRAFT_454313 [Hyaloscypha variabilis F]